MRKAPDLRLLALIRDGSEPAFAALVERHRPAMLACTRRALNPYEAEEAVQIALINAWRALSRGCEVSEPRAWLLTIARRAGLQLLRDRPRRHDGLDESLVGGLSVAEQIERDTHAREVLRALAQLPWQEREALVHTALHGRSGRETGASLGVSESVVRQLVFRARRRVRDAVGLAPSVGLLPRALAWLTRPGAGLVRASLPWPPAEAAGGAAAGLATVVAATVILALPGAHHRPGASRADAASPPPAAQHAHPPRRSRASRAGSGSVSSLRQRSSTARIAVPTVSPGTSPERDSSGAGAVPGGQEMRSSSASLPPSAAEAPGGEPSGVAGPGAPDTTGAAAEAPGGSSSPGGDAPAQGVAGEAVSDVAQVVESVTERTLPAARSTVEGAVEHARALPGTVQATLEAGKQFVQEALPKPLGRL